MVSIHSHQSLTMPFLCFCDGDLRTPRPSGPPEATCTEAFQRSTLSANPKRNSNPQQGGLTYPLPNLSPGSEWLGCSWSPKTGEFASRATALQSFLTEASTLHSSRVLALAFNNSMMSAGRTLGSDVACYKINLTLAGMVRTKTNYSCGLML